MEGKLIKLVVLTTRCEFGAELLRCLTARNIPVDAIILEKGYSVSRFAHYIKIRGFTETVKTIIQRIAGIILPATAPGWFRNEFYRNYSENVFLVEDLGGTECQKILTGIKPDIIALGRTRILGEKIIRIPVCGILNAHPGLLPKYRGIDTVEWAIYNGDVIGATVHYIDIGVDTGPVIAQKAVEIIPGDNLDSLNKKVDKTSIELMAEVILRIRNGEKVATIQQQPSQGRQYYRMPHKLVIVTRTKLKNLKRVTSG